MALGLGLTIDACCARPAQPATTRSAFVQTPFGARFIQHALQSGRRAAFVMPGSDIGYGEFLARVEACASWLVGEGCARSAVVGLTVADEATHLVASAALLALGIPQVCLATREPIALRERLAKRLGVRHVVLTDPAHALTGAKSLRLTPARLTPAAAAHAAHAAHVADAADAADAALSGEPIEAFDPEAPSIYFTSSGTTGEPKIIGMSQRVLAWRAERTSDAQALTDEDRTLMLVSVEEYPAKTRRLFSLYHGLTSVLQSPAGVEPWPVQRLCASLDVTWLELNVLQASSLIVDSAVHGPLPATTRTFVSGSRVPAQLRREFAAAIGAPLFVNYGAREVGRIATTYKPGGAPQDDPALATVGTPVPWIDFEIVDAAGRSVSRGEVGEVRVRSEGMIDGYHRDPEATARHFRGGWFYPGDSASLAASGELTIHGRTDDMMNLNSLKIFPAEIERVLEEHPAVRAAAAFSVSSAVHGDIPVAAVELHDSADVEVDALLADARRQLGVRAPRRIIVLAALPRNTTGKILKRELIALVVPGSC